MTEVDFLKLAEAGYTRIPLVAEARADLYTPLAVYVLLAGGPYSYLLESVVGGERIAPAPAALRFGGRVVRAGKVMHGRQMLQNFIQGEMP